MQHPFEGILECAAASDRATGELVGQNAILSGPSSRRSFLQRALAAAAGVVGLGLAAGRRAAAQVSGGLGGQGRGSASPPIIQHGDRRPTTLALGEEAGGYRPSPPSPPSPPRYTTYALGEEGTATTYALGEEGAYRPWRPPYRTRPPHGGYDRYRPAPVTTYALGEEGGGYWGW